MGRLHRYWRAKLRGGQRCDEHGGAGGRVFHVPAFGYIVGHTGNYDTPLVVMAVFTAAAAFFWLAIDPTVRFSPRPGEVKSAQCSE
ncbi:MAG: hypothetical protein V4773_29275 [Verrucomicrobiota bacterium]